MSENKKYLWPSNREFSKHMNLLGKFFYYTGAGRFQKTTRYEGGGGYKKFFVMNWWHPFTWLYAAANALLSLLSGIILALGSFFKTLTASSTIYIESPLKKNPDYKEN